jgi:hypothetical protein
MTLRNAPLLGQDGGSCRDDLPDGRSEIFLQMGLDRKSPDGQITYSSEATGGATAGQHAGQ